MSQITMAGRAPGSGTVSPAAWVALGLALIGALGLGFGQSPRIAALFVVGGAFGLVLYHAAFGFTSAWRNFIRDGRGRGLRAQMVMLAIAVALFFPALAAGSLFGQEVSGFVSPVGTSVLVGAFIFGIGMQLGGGCASGTLYTAGGGNARMLITLAFFIIGSLLATVHFDWWMALPAFAPVSIVDSVGAPLGIVLSLAVFAAIAAVTILVEKRRHGGLEQADAPKRQGLARFARGPWPLVAGAIALALLNFVTLALAGRPWGITSAFALWGAKLSELGGIDPSAWFYWQQPGNAAALSSSIFADITSVMNIRHHPRRPPRRGPRRPAGAELRHSAALHPGRGDRRTAAGLWRANRLRLQYRRLFRWHRLGQPAWLAVAGRRLCRLGSRRAPAAVLLRRRTAARHPGRLTAPTIHRPFERPSRHPRGGFFAGLSEDKGLGILPFQKTASEPAQTRLDSPGPLWNP